ncbi:MAG: cell division protein ZapD [Gammaproteobacteria bacterium]
MAEQSTLFPDIGPTTVFEQPLNERARSCLRLEHLFGGLNKGLSGDSEWDSREALCAMIEIGDLLARTDIKGELIKELERVQGKLKSLRSNPAVDQQALEDAIAEVSPLISTLKQSNCQPGATIRNDELVNQFRQRVTIPGGTCSFDLPSFHHWLQREPTARADALRRWGEDLQIVSTAVNKILNLVRSSTPGISVVGANGFYQSKIETNYECQLIRITVSNELEVFPEISGGKHRFTVRFMTQTETSARPEQVTRDIPFDLQCCGL